MRRDGITGITLLFPSPSSQAVNEQHFELQARPAINEASARTAYPTRIPTAIHPQPGVHTSGPVISSSLDPRSRWLASTASIDHCVNKSSWFPCDSPMPTDPAAIPAPTAQHHRRPSPYDRPCQPTSNTRESVNRPAGPYAVHGGPVATSDPSPYLFETCDGPTGPHAQPAARTPTPPQPCSAPHNTTAARAETRGGARTTRPFSSAQLPQQPLSGTAAEACQDRLQTDPWAMDRSAKRLCTGSAYERSSDVTSPYHMYHSYASTARTPHQWSQTPSAEDSNPWQMTPPNYPPKLRSRPARLLPATHPTVHPPYRPQASLEYVPSCSAGTSGFPVALAALSTALDTTSPFHAALDSTTQGVMSALSRWLLGDPSAALSIASSNGERAPQSLAALRWAFSAVDSLLPTWLGRQGGSLDLSEVWEIWETSKRHVPLTVEPTFVIRAVQGDLKLLDVHATLTWALTSVCDGQPGQSADASAALVPLGRPKDPWGNSLGDEVQEVIQSAAGVQLWLQQRVCRHRIKLQHILESETDAELAANGLDRSMFHGPTPLSSSVRANSENTLGQSD